MAMSTVYFCNVYIMIMLCGCSSDFAVRIKRASTCCAVIDLAIFIPCSIIVLLLNGESG